MNKNNNVNKNESEQKIYKSTIITNNKIYEMVYDDLVENKTYFVGSDNYGNIENNLDFVEIENQKIFPIPKNNNLIKGNVVHFPSLISPYQNEEEILSEIKTFIHKYLDISEEFEEIATHYVLFTWLYDRFNELPYLRTLGDYGSGKSRFLQTIGILCYKPIFTGGATTPSPIFRIINELKGTLIIDEADFKYSDKDSEIVKILNTGYQKGIPVLRVEGKGVYDVKTYDVFCPKIIATRETFTDRALESRFLKEDMYKTNLRNDIPSSLDDSFYGDAKFIRNKLLMWRLRNYFRPLSFNHEKIENIHPRLNQIIGPLLSIIKDEKVIERLKSFVIKYNKEMVDDRGFSWEAEIVSAVLMLKKELTKDDITIKEITKAVIESINDENEKITTKKIGGYLRKKLQLKTHRTRIGYVLSIKENKERLDTWKNKLGLKEETISCEDVNVVNIAMHTEDTKDTF